MSLLLKALAQVDSRSRAPVAAVQDTKSQAAIVGATPNESRSERAERQRRPEPVDEPAADLYLIHPATSTATFDLASRCAASTNCSPAADGSFIASALSQTDWPNGRVSKAVAEAIAITTVGSPRAKTQDPSESTLRDFA